MAAKKKPTKKTAKPAKAKAPATRRICEEGMQNIIRANRRRWAGYDKLTLRQKKKVLGGGRQPAR